MAPSGWSPSSSVPSPRSGSNRLWLARAGFSSCSECLCPSCRDDAVILALDSRCRLRHNGWFPSSLDGWFRTGVLSYATTRGRRCVLGNDRVFSLAAWLCCATDFSFACCLWYVGFFAVVGSSVGCVVKWSELLPATNVLIMNINHTRIPQSLRLKCSQVSWYFNISCMEPALICSFVVVNPFYPEYDSNRSYPFYPEYDSSRSYPFYPEYDSSRSLHLTWLPCTLTFWNPIGWLTLNDVIISGSLGNSYFSTNQCRSLGIRSTKRILPS